MCNEELLREKSISIVSGLDRIVESNMAGKFNHYKSSEARSGKVSWKK
jgi:hypothetical protein